MVNVFESGVIFDSVFSFGVEVNEEVPGDEVLSLLLLHEELLEVTVSVKPSTLLPIELYFMLET